jgi:hypothetical protein
VEILEQEKLFYKTLYNKPSAPDKDTFQTTFLNSTNIPKIDQETKILKDQELTMEECSTPLKDLANNKSPGSDGFVPELFFFFGLI